MPQFVDRRLEAVILFTGPGAKKGFHVGHGLHVLCARKLFECREIPKKPCHRFVLAGGWFSLGRLRAGVRICFFTLINGRL